MPENHNGPPPQRVMLVRGTDPASAAFNSFHVIEDVAEGRAMFGHSLNHPETWEGYEYVLDESKPRIPVSTDGWGTAGQL